MIFENENGKAVAVIGSRTFDDKEMLYKYLSTRKDKIKVIVSGHARGADSLAEQFAIDYGIPYLVFPALWHDPETGIFSKGAGMRRNAWIIRNSDVIIAFMQKGGSRGTQNSIDTAKMMGKPVQIIEFTPKEKQDITDISEI